MPRRPPSAAGGHIPNKKRWGASTGGRGSPESGRGAPVIFRGSDLAGDRGRRSFASDSGRIPNKLGPLLHRRQPLLWDLTPETRMGRRTTRHGRLSGRTHKSGHLLRASPALLHVCRSPVPPLGAHFSTDARSSLKERLRMVRRKRSDAAPALACRSSGAISQASQHPAQQEEHDTAARPRGAPGRYGLRLWAGCHPRLLGLSLEEPIGPRKRPGPHEARVPPLEGVAPFPGARTGHKSREARALCGACRRSRPRAP